MVGLHWSGGSPASALRPAQTVLTVNATLTTLIGLAACESIMVKRRTENTTCDDEEKAIDNRPSLSSAVRWQDRYHDIKVMQHLGWNEAWFPSIYVRHSFKNSVYVFLIWTRRRYDYLNEKAHGIITLCSCNNREGYRSLKMPYSSRRQNNKEGHHY